MTQTLTRPAQPKILKASVDERAIDVASRIFTASASDIFAELLQNARRAGATCVDISIMDDDDRVYVIVSDDGCGIADPDDLLRFGGSGWSEDTQSREDSAGMGMFALAQYGVIVQSKTEGGEAFCVDIRPEVFRGESTATVGTCNKTDTGTYLSFVMNYENPVKVIQAAESASKYVPLAISITCSARNEHKEMISREPTQNGQANFLEGAVLVREYTFGRIGVFLDDRRDIGFRRQDNANFFGRTLRVTLPRLSDTKRRKWTARIDITDASDLRFALPARKEIVENAPFLALYREVKACLFRAALADGTHQLTYEHYLEARRLDLGIDVPEAQPILRRWHPSSADDGTCDTPANDTPLDLDVLDPETRARVTLMTDCPALVEQGFRLVENVPGDTAPERYCGLILAQPSPSMAGYSWYDDLKVVDSIQIDVECGGNTATFDAEEFAEESMFGNWPPLALGEPDDETRYGGKDRGEQILTAERLDLAWKVRPPAREAGTRGVESYIQPLPFLPYGYTYDAEDITMFVSPAFREAPDHSLLSTYLEKMCFCASDGSESDSWDTQHYDFQNQLARFIRDHFMSDTERMQAILRDALLYKLDGVPEDTPINIVVGGKRVEIRVSAHPLVESSQEDASAKDAA